MLILLALSHLAKTASRGNCVVVEAIFISSANNLCVLIIFQLTLQDSGRCHESKTR